jgi:hypothetical protein
MGKTSYDLRSFAPGKRFLDDAKIDGMIYASVEHPPVYGGGEELHEQEALKVSGVHQTVLIDPFKTAGGISAAWWAAR